ncbi:MAG: thermonuclease family protein [Candidatus Scalindua sp.]|jgi:micrococcal nuclease|nr:thermonuclease family protein [Candidatus Scalindua sp.]MDV5166325.1 thermonuclease family protein [Candidatus Scalindua sp.]
MLKKKKDIRKEIKALVLVFVLVLVSSPIYARQKTMVTRTIDGDVIQIIYGGVEKRVRLIGIDAPESRIDRKALKDANMSDHDIEAIVEMGAKAKAYVNSLIKRGVFIKIEFDEKEMDRYGRLLCYVYLSNGKMLNEEIVRAGYANVKSVPPNVKYEDRFLEAFEYAQEMRRGLWEEQID